MTLSKIVTHASEQIRRQSAWELKIFKERWNQAITEDKSWVKPFKSD